MKRIFIAAAAMLSTAFAGETPGDPERLEGEVALPDLPAESDAGELVSFAREIRDEKGCAAAAPAYRVVAGMGEGEEAAQHELGACLLDLKGATGIETALFRQEGEFWLTRAAFAGNARAQRRLAMEMAAPANPLHDTKGALMWALIYAKNPTADLYGYKALPSTLIPGLKSSLDEVAIAETEKFVAEFAPIALAKYEGPNRDRKDADFHKRSDVPPPGERRNLKM